MAIDYVSPNTGTTLSSSPNGNANNIRQLWQKGALLAEQNEDFFQEMESKSDRGLIWAKTEPSKGSGQIMNFTTQSGFYGKGKYGEAQFETSADFEKIKQGNFQLKVDFVRNAVRTTERMEEVVGMRGDIDSGLNVELGKWLGRLKAEQLLGLVTRKLPVANLMWANGKASDDKLLTADVLDWDNIVTSGQAMKPMGGQPANISKINGNPVWAQTYIATETALTSLKLDSDWKAMLQQGDVRGRGNTVFAGGYPAVDGHAIVPYNVINHDGDGPVGSFLNPYAYLDVQPANDSAAIVVKGGGAGWTTGIDYLRYFQGMPYTFVDTGAHTLNNAGASDTGTYFFIIYNLTGADAGKWGMYAYRGVGTTAGNDGTQITVVGKLYSSKTGVGLQYMGGDGFTAATGDAAAQSAGSGRVVYNAAINTWVHPVGSLIIPCNCRGVPIGRTPILGRAGIMRGYGKYRAEHTVDKNDGGFVTSRYITSVFGQNFRFDRKDRVPAVAMLTHALSIPGISLPAVTA